MWRAGYRLLLWFAFPFVLARLWWRGRQEPLYSEKPGERFGFYETAPGLAALSEAMGRIAGSEPASGEWCWALRPKTV